MKILILFSIPIILADNIPARAQVNQRIQDAGVIGPSPSAIAALTVCIQEEFYKQTPMMELITPVMACLQSSIGMSKLGMWGLTVLPPMEACLISKGSSSTKVASDAASVIAPEIMLFYNNMMTNFTASKKKGQTHDKVLNNGFSMMVKKYTLTYINKLCMMVVKNMSVAQIKCCFDNAKTVVDFTRYACYLGASKSNLLG